MSDERLDIDMSDVSLSESWADAQADTPTMGHDRSDSEDTLSNLSFDNFVVDSGGGENPGGGGDNGAGGTMMEAAARPGLNLRNGHLNGRSSNKDSGGLGSGGQVQIRVTNSDSESLQLDLPPGMVYQPPTVDFPSSPSQLKISQGEAFMPKEEPGAVSEDDASFASSCRAHLDLNFQNGGVRLTKKEEELRSKSIVGGLKVPSFEISGCSENDNQPESLLQPEASDVLDDYMEDFYLPMSHESVMSRQTSFRRKVQKHLETAAAETAINELNKFDRMLSSYEEEPEDEYKSSMTECENCHNNNDKKSNCQNCLVVKSRVQELRSSEVEKGRQFPHTLHSTPTNFRLNGDISRTFDPSSKILDFEDEGLELEDGSPSMMTFVDIDAICDAHAPNLMNGHSKQDEPPESLMNGDLESNYFLPRTTLDKLDSVYESINFTNLYTLSGELKHILSPVEIDEILTNREQLQNVVNPAVIAALSWSLNETSLPPGSIVTGSEDESIISVKAKPSENESGLLIDTTKESKSSSISNGFHSDSNHSDVSEDETSSRQIEDNNNKKVVPVKDEYNVVENNNVSNFERGNLQNTSLRRKVKLESSLNSGDLEKYTEPEEKPVIHSGKKIKAFPVIGDRNNWNSLENLDDMDVESNSEGKKSGEDVFLVRRDSKRFNKGETERIIEGLFVESKNASNGTLKRIKVPLHIADDDDADIELYSRDSSLVDVSLGAESDGESAKNAVHKKRIGVDDKILSAASDLDDSSQATDIDVTQSDVFHSIINTLSKQANNDDRTLNSEDGTDEDVTLDIDTPDDMEDSILGTLDSIAVTPTIPVERIPELTAEEELEDDRRWRSFRIGANDIQIDLKAIQPYRRVLSHGGYFDAEKRVAIILFSGCFLPDRSRREYSYLMDHLFLYVLSSLEELIVDDYMLVYLHGATPKSCQPTFGWLKRCYQLIDRKLRKNLKGLYLVHPTFWLRTVVACTKPFISTKFSRKVQFVNTLAELCLEIPTEHLVIPDCVLQYDFDMKVAELKRQNQMI